MFKMLCCWKKDTTSDRDAWRYHHTDFPSPPPPNDNSPLPPMPPPHSPHAPKYDGNPSPQSLQIYFDEIDVLCRQRNMGDKYITEWALEYVEDEGDRAVMKDAGMGCRCDWENFKIFVGVLFEEGKKRRGVGRDWKKIL